MSRQVDLTSVEQIWTDFRIATMSEASSLPYGLLEGFWIGVTAGKVVWISPKPEHTPSKEGIQWIHGRQRLLTPGLIDCHTHCVYGGNRADEWERRLSGETYHDIAARGGGILSTVRATREAAEESLVVSGSQRLQSLISEGVTTVEIKSGYGLNLETELKMLRAAKGLETHLGIDVATTLLAAHAVPPEFRGRADEYISWVCDEMIPAAREYCSAVDVFCETIAFSVAQSTRVLQTAKDLGLDVKAHTEQLSQLGFARIAAEMGAVSVDHLEYLSAADCGVLSRCGTVATLLPGAFYYLRETQQPPVQRLLSEGVPIAISTDCNPGSSPLLSLRTAANMACLIFGLTPEQALAGVTRNAAQALGLQNRCGTIEVGKDADFAIWDVETPSEVFYSLGGSPCIASFKRGQAVWTSQGLEYVLTDSQIRPAIRL